MQNDRIDLIESFLKQNEQFDSKSKVIQYLVDKKIASGNIKEACEKIGFIDAKIKDAYLEKFKIYCLIFKDKKSDAQLLLDLLREQKQSSKYYDDRINFLLGVTDKTSSKINEKNLLNFYLSSITIANFKYEPTKNTKPEIWKYLNAANLIKLDDNRDKEKLKSLETAANENQFDKCIIFYNNFKNVITQIPQAEQIIPANSKSIKSKEEGSYSFEFEPDEDEILEDLLPRNISTQVFKAFLENAASEQGSRMTAMDNATRNAGDLVDKLTINYNRSRQASITKELIEIISGAESL